MLAILVESASFFGYVSLLKQMILLRVLPKPKVLNLVGFFVKVTTKSPITSCPSSSNSSKTKISILLKITLVQAEQILSRYFDMKIA